MLLAAPQGVKAPVYTGQSAATLAEQSGMPPSGRRVDVRGRPLFETMTVRAGTSG